ncbi:unnamed protein product [Amaranthus hypochondriacus]
MVSFYVLFFLVFVFSSFIVLFKFLKADGDFTLLSKKINHEQIEDKVVWISGASRGLGEALAKHFASLGAKLILSARNDVELERVKNELNGKHAPSEVKILPLDLTLGEDTLREAVQRAEAFFPASGVDYMIHNAAYERPKSTALDVSEDNLKATFNVNVIGAITLTKLLAPYMLKRGRGHFVVTSSTAGKIPSSNKAVYSASKFALLGYFHSLRSELYHKGIKVTIVCPGSIETSSNIANAGNSGQGRPSKLQKSVSVERCAQLMVIAASHGLKEAWICNQPMLAVMYVAQYMPTVCFWLMDKIGGKRVGEDARSKGKTT